ncbi:MAG: amino acid permease [Chloroflexi bacterium]|nr:amino acid permease [Chloroflexota bacterium]
MIPGSDGGDGGRVLLPLHHDTGPLWNRSGRPGGPDAPTSTHDRAGVTVTPVRLQRTLGLGRAVAIGLSGTFGGGIFVLVGPAAGQAGPSILLAFVLAFAAALLFALPYAELTSRYPSAGGGYAATRATLGEGWGFLMGWEYWGAWVGVGGCVSLGFGGYLHALTGWPSLPCSLALVAGITAFNLCGQHLVSRAQVAVIILGGSALATFGLLGLAHTHAGQFIPFLPHGLAGVAAAAPAALLALNGFDTVAAAGEEIVRPERTIPQAILLTLLIALGVYLVVTTVAVGTVSSAQLGRSSTPLALAARTFLGAAGTTLISIAALLTTASTANAAVGAGSRIIFGMARDGTLPCAMTRLRGEKGPPWVAVLLSGIALAVVTSAGSIAAAASIGASLYALHYAFPLVGLARLKLRRTPTTSFRTPAPGILLPLAGAACLLLLAATGWVGTVGGLSWLFVGLLAYVGGCVVRARRAESPCAARGDAQAA